jgi:hypothetical protein
MDRKTAFDRAVRFVVERGAAAPEHNSGVTLLEHVLGTYRVLERWNASPALLAAGLLHSVYSTEHFRIALASYDEREAVREIAGDEAERLAFLFCVKESTSLFDLAERASDGGALDLRDWRGTGSHPVTAMEIASLVNLVAANALEQVPRNDATLRRDLPSIARATHLLLPLAAREPAFSVPAGAR